MLQSLIVNRYSSPKDTLQGRWQLTRPRVPETDQGNAAVFQNRLPPRLTTGCGGRTDRYRKDRRLLKKPNGSTERPVMRPHRTRPRVPETGQGKTEQITVKACGRTQRDMGWIGQKMFEELDKINRRPEPFAFYTARDLWTDRAHVKADALFPSQQGNRSFLPERHVYGPIGRMDRFPFQRGRRHEDRRFRLRSGVVCDAAGEKRTRKSPV